MNARVWISALMILSAQAGLAGIYKCKVDGETIYSQSPCGDDAVVIRGSKQPESNDPVQKQQEAAKLAEKTGDHCILMENAAENIMRSRQAGVQMSEMMHMLDSSGNKQAIRLNRALVTAAYSKTRWHTEKVIEREVQNFKEQAYKACVSGKSK